ncbi:MAG TPA: hypothetical protein VGE21_12215 [Flavobacteriales bacterium]
MRIIKHALPIVGLCAAWTLSTLELCAASPARGTTDVHAVQLTGWLHVEADGFQETTVEVEVNGVQFPVPVTRSGRFDLSLPLDVEVVVRFAHPGHLTKELTVDTHNSRTGTPGKHKRKLQFAVILQDAEVMSGFDYDGPVGNISFDAQGGCTVIDHTLKLRPGRNMLKVFEG